MRIKVRYFQHGLLIVLIFSVFLIAVGKCQDEEEDEEDTYDEELGDGESTTTRRSRTSSTTAKSEVASGQSSGSSTQRSGTEATTRNTEVTPASAPVPTTRAATARTTTTESEYEDDEETTTEQGYGYVFRPLNNLIDNIVAGNVTGIVDNALSIRTPPEIRAFVNNVMNNVFGAGIGTALKQFMPNLFSTSAPPTVTSPGRDPIPVQSIIQQPIPITAVLTARTNGTEDDKAAKKQQPLQLSVGHPGAPASRLRCEVIM